MSTNLDASPYVGRLAICRVQHGTIRKGQTVAWCRSNGDVQSVRITDLYVTESLERVPADDAGPGEIIAVAGLEDVTIGETLTDVEDPRPLPVLVVDEPSLSMTIGINTSPMAGLDGGQADRPHTQGLDSTKSWSATCRYEYYLPIPDTWSVQGRGELQLAVLVETMRREGFELTVGKPQVVTREVNGRLHEPVEQLTIDLPEEHVGAAGRVLSTRKARMLEMVNHGTGWVRLEYLVPARGLIGIRTEFLTETRGTATLHNVFHDYEPWMGEIRTRRNGSMVADRTGAANTFALINLQERGALFVGPGVQVYEGMIVGEGSRPDELDVNATKEKKLTNMRASGSDDTVRLTPARPLSLEQALEFIADDESVEVTPHSLRLRKVELSATTRGRDRKRLAAARA